LCRAVVPLESQHEASHYKRTSPSFSESNTLNLKCQRLTSLVARNPHDSETPRTLLPILALRSPPACIAPTAEDALCMGLDGLRPDWHGSAWGRARARGGLAVASSLPHAKATAWPFGRKQTSPGDQVLSYGYDKHCKESRLGLAGM
jgi:hypothetical protein